MCINCQLSLNEKYLLVEMHYINIKDKIVSKYTYGVCCITTFIYFEVIARYL